MKIETVRIENIELHNFKNVKFGELSFQNTRKVPYQASVLGLYGQNGSGKTALIDAMELLQFLLRGEVVPHYFADYIHVESDKAFLVYAFSLKIQGEDKPVSLRYEVSLAKKDLSSNNGTLGVSQSGMELNRVLIQDEKLVVSGGREKKRILFDGSKKDPFGATLKPDRLSALGEADVRMEADVIKRIACEQNSKSFLFSHELGVIFEKHFTGSRDVVFLRRLAGYGLAELFVITTASLGVISLQALPLSFKQYEDKSFGTIMLPLKRPTLIPKSVLSASAQVIEGMNVVLDKIVPGLTIGLKSLGDELDKNGHVLTKVEIVSHKNASDIPLRYESEGIKKIVSILNLLMGVYNNSSLTVVIDELDSGVFEYLLGELLQIISERGKGQLIFTSHNLRLLETIDRGFVAFTTTNPNNRYIRLKGVKTTNNLRDFYYRDLMLGGQDEELYDETHNQEIALALRSAGRRSQ